MKRLQLLGLLLEREQGRRDDAQEAVRAALRGEEAARAQLDGLTRYRGEYCARWSAHFSTSSTIEILRCYQAFIGRLDQAIGQQQGVVRSAQAGLEVARKRLVEREIRVATVERLIDRRRALLARMQDRREQKNLDELSQRRPAVAGLVGL
jgi:flagellar FliJ protein